MLPQVPPGDLGVGGIVPFDLGKASHRVAEVRQVEGACGVVVRKAADLLACRRPLDYRECGIRKLADVRSAPRRRRGVGLSYNQKGEEQGNKASAHLIAPEALAPRHVGCPIDGLAPL